MLATREVPGQAFGSGQPAVACQLPLGAAPKCRFSNRRAYAQTISASIAIRGLGVASGILAARLLGPAGRGELAVIIFFPILMIPVGEFELARSLAYDVSRETEVHPQVVSTGFWLALAFGCIQALALGLALPIVLPADKLHLLPAARWFVAYLPATYVTAALMGIDQGRGRFGRFSLLQALPGALYVLSILAVWCLGTISPQWFALGILAGVVTTCVLRVAMDWDVIARVLPEWDSAKRLLRRGFTFYLPAVAGYLLSRADMLLAVRLLPTAALGLYAVGQAISVGQLGVVLPFMQVSFSAVAGEADHAEALRTLARHFRLSQLAATGVGLTLALLTPWAVRVLFGAPFAGATVPALFLVGAMMLWGMGQVLDQGLRAAMHPRVGIVSNAAGLILLLGLGIPGCLHHGIDGLAAATLVAEFGNLAVLIGVCVARFGLPGRLFWAFDALTFRELKAAIGL